ncbi:MAG TPA: 16S rRNA (guanine(966)-N(2))-methyltransferase RsmD [Acidimicrobiales bacterium]|jgi:16S rRNA (guanine966-N2)-methyltransferase
MRVVAGTARGRPLRAPAGRDTRPTSDRVREAMFSMLTSMDALEGVDVLDLFAGSGALGIEALSRGAARVTFVDQDRAAVAAVRANLEVVGEASSRAEVVLGDAVRFAVVAPQVDLTLADPPYRFDGWGPLLAALEGRTGLLVAETGAEWEPGPGWETVKVKRYGGTVVTVAQPTARPKPLLRQEGET